MGTQFPKEFVTMMLHEDIDRNIFQIIYHVNFPEPELDFENGFYLNGCENVFEMERKTHHLKFYFKNVLLCIFFNY